MLLCNPLVKLQQILGNFLRDAAALGSGRFPGLLFPGKLHFDLFFLPRNHLLGFLQLCFQPFHPALGFLDRHHLLQHAVFGF